MEELNRAFAKALCQIAFKSRVPLYKEATSKGPKINAQTDRKIEKLNKERIKLNGLLSQGSITKVDSDRFTERIRAITREMEELYDKERERKEKKVCDNIKVDSKAFFTYANSFRKSKTRIGPLKSGGNYWNCLLYTSPSPRDRTRSRMPSSA